MAEFWEKSFQEKGAMWGAAPANSAIMAAESFSEKGYREILIPGIGYGRNAQPFLDAGLNVTGIEISETAIGMLEKNFGSKIKIFHGPVANMPFERKLYDGIFSFALLHLLNAGDRQKFIMNSYTRLKSGGTMIFITIAETAPMFGAGKKISDRLYETMPGVRLFFYDEPSIYSEFKQSGLKQFRQISELNQMPGSPALDFLWIECSKKVQD